MGTKVTTEKQILRQLDDGLVLRHATVEDTEAVAEFNSRVHSDEGWDKPFAPLAAWTRDLMNGQHPTFSVEDFLVVEDTNTGALVSTMNLIDQVWAYEGIEFPVGRPELVGTHPDYRRRGLVRAQFEEAHRMSAERGHMVQAITGIPFYYRQFGYEMTLALGGGKEAPIGLIPELKDDEQEPFNIRPATEEDLDFIWEVNEQRRARYMVSCVRDREMVQYELNGRSKDSITRGEYRIIETLEGEAVGFLMHPPMIWRPAIHLDIYEVKAGASWYAITPSVLRYLKATGEEYAKKAEKHNLERFQLNLGEAHPVYDVIPHLTWKHHNAYSWYMRVPDIPAFLGHIGPVLEKRIAESPLLVGLTEEVKLNFYTSGVNLIFEAGKLKSSETWQPVQRTDEGTVRFPYLTFLQVLFGQRSYKEVEAAYADCYGEGKAEIVLNTLFPKKASRVWGIQ
ncbi:MAG: GNAT family N-acetyltransferase [Anaerolineales bacterium]|nr:GNAT family N-acetyltransferase [Anaerolineales bacterium]